ncbi:MAG TPA: hypothetical protein VGJ75_18100 [Dongiaceae bacterium]
MSIPSLFFRTAVLLAIAGIVLGIFMGVNQDFRLAHMHAHLNLLGWVSFFILAVIIRWSRRRPRACCPSCTTASAWSGS